MKKFKSLEHMRAYSRRKSLAYYHKMMSDPERAEAYRVKRRKYEKKRYKAMMRELREQEE